MYEKRIEIRWRDIDGICHVNNAVYLTYLEEVRDEWLRSVFGADADVTRYVIARIEIDYRAQLRPSDGSVIGTCRLGSIGRSSFRSVERISKLNGELAADATCVLVAWERAGRSRPLDDWELDALARERERTP